MSLFYTVVARKRETPAIGGGSSLLTGLNAYWKLEDLTESVGGLTLTNTNAATFTTGRVNNGATFVGASSQYLSRADNVAFQMGTTTNFTVAAWYKTSNPHTGVVGVICFYGTISGVGYGIYFQNQSVKSHIVDGPHLVEANNTADATDDGNWHLAVMTVDRTGNITFYRDNVLRQAASCVSVTGSLNNATIFLGIGGRADGGAGNFLTGMVDEAGIWSRILTLDERTTLYNSGTGVTYPF